MNKNKKNYSKKNYIEIAKIISKSEYITDLIYNHSKVLGVCNY